MSTVLVFHEVQDGQRWAKAWKKGPGSRHDMFAKIGVKARNFHDPKNPNSTGLILDVPDMAKLPMKEDGLKPKRCACWRSSRRKHCADCRAVSSSATFIRRRAQVIVRIPRGTVHAFHDAGEFV